MTYKLRPLHSPLCILLLCLTLTGCASLGANQGDESSHITYNPVDRTTPAQVAFFNTMAEGATQTEPDVSQLPELSVDAIVNSFNRDKKETDRMLADKLLKVKGTVFYGPTNKGYQGLNIYYLGLKGENETMAFLFVGLKYVEKLKALKKGDPVVVAGYYMPGEKLVPKLFQCFFPPE